ncbi:MAG: hypothetical protein R3A51_02010 [Nannocystaceae bacterium]
MTRILITSVGSSPGLDIARSLALDPTLTLVGGDAGPWGRRLGARVCHEVIALPRADRSPTAYLDALDRALTQQAIDVVLVSLDVEVAAVAACGRAPCRPCPLPPIDALAVTLDKARTAALAGERVPASRELSSADELAAAFAAIAPPVWLRPSTGTSGQASLRVDSVEEARMWIALWARRGVAGPWLVQEFLPGRNINWTGLYVDGRLAASACMERRGYYLDTVAVSGVTGQVRLCATIDAPAAAAVADEVARAVCGGRPRGLLSVDLREDRRGRPRVTEVNPRLAGRPWLYTQAGVNLPLAAARALLGRPLGDAVAPGGARVGLQMYRQLDVAPLLVEEGADDDGLAP